MKACLIAAFFCLTVAGSASAQIMEMNGTWVLNGDKSIGPYPKAETIVYRIKAGEQGYTMDSTEQDGRKGHTEWTVPYDGMDHPTAAPRPMATQDGATAPARPAGTGTVSIRKLDANTELVTNKRDGKVTSTYTRVLTDNGRTIMSVGRNAEGKVQWVRVFEKQ